MSLYHKLFFVFSMAYLLLRMAFMTYVAANINEESKRPREVLFSLPTAGYSTEVSVAECRPERLGGRQARNAALRCGPAYPLLRGRRSSLQPGSSRPCKRASAVCFLFCLPPGLAGFPHGCLPASPSVHCPSDRPIRGL